jgi:hypothetical protein
MYRTIKCIGGGKRWVHLYMSFNFGTVYGRVPNIESSRKPSLQYVLFCRLFGTKSKETTLATAQNRKLLLPTINVLTTGPEAKCHITLEFRQGAIRHNILNRKIFSIYSFILSRLVF